MTRVLQSPYLLGIAGRNFSSDRLVVIMVRSDPAVPKPGNGTHYAFWSVPMYSKNDSGPR